MDKGRIRVKAPRGGYLPDADLLGAKLVGMDEEGRSVAFRIDSIIPYRDSIVDMTLYSFSSPDSLGHWNNSCGPDRMGRRRGFVMEGYFDAKALQVEDSSAFTVTCTSGSAGKCVLFGYGPWLKGTDGSSIKPLFQACTRMVRADYCGDGTPHTRNGTFIELWDYKGIQGDDHRSPNRFEASWAPEGAVWIKRTRIPEVATLDSIAKECPERYRTKMSVPSDTLGFGEAVLFNRSR
ncbi:MAG: hypothetical protein JWP91_3292 [Fibrobacteres bacterium]|nr:hypothetical protein [Fibrobacterota bacterium]